MIEKIVILAFFRTAGVPEVSIASVFSFSSPQLGLLGDQHWVIGTVGRLCCPLATIFEPLQDCQK